MPRRSLELKDEKGKLTSQYREILNRAEAAKRSVNSEEKESLAKLDLRFEELDQDIVLHEKQEARESDGAGRTDPKHALVPPANDGKDKKPVRNAIRASADYVKAFEAYLSTGRMGDVSPEIRNAMQADNDSSLGYLTAPEQFSDRVIEVVDNQVFMRTLATVTKLTSAQSLGFPVRESDVDDAEWTPELQTGSDTVLNVSKREFRPHPLAKRVKLSKKLIRLTPGSVDLVLRRLGYKFGVAAEKGYMVGDGNQKALGVFVNSENGISAARDVVTGSATGITNPDALIDALYTLKPQYQKVATGLFHRDGVRMIRKLKDTQGRYLWQPGITSGQPDTILDRPFIMSEYAPNTYTNGLYFGMFGDFSKYEIVDALDMEIQVLSELYAESNQVGYIGRMETDGMPVLEEAFVRLKCAAA